MAEPATALTPGPTITAAAPQPLDIGPQLAETFDAIAFLAATAPRGADHLRASMSGPTSSIG